MQNKGEQSYLELLADVLANGAKKPIFSANGKLTTVLNGQQTEHNADELYLLSVFGRQLRFNMADGLPVYTTKRVAWKSAIGEMLWFLQGSGDVAQLHRSGITIWNSWAYKYAKQKGYAGSFEQFVKDRLEPAYSQFHMPVPYTDFTNWAVPFAQAIDQTSWAIDTLKARPEAKHCVVSAWKPDRLYEMATSESVVLPACHAFHQLVVNNGKLSLMVTIRSNDLPIGNAFNVAQYAMLLHMYAICIGYEPGELVVSIGDAHIYSNQMAGVQEQLAREPLPFPQLKIANRGQQYLQDFQLSDFELIGYNCHKRIDMPVTIVGGFA